VRIRAAQVITESEKLCSSRFSTPAPACEFRCKGDRLKLAVCSNCNDRNAELLERQRPTLS